MLNKTNQLNEEQLKNLEQLKAVCKKMDGNVPNVYIHLLAQKRALPTILLYYEQDADCHSHPEELTTKDLHEVSRDSSLRLERRNQGHKQPQLIGFLSVYFFYDHAVEVAVLIHPSSRRKGIAKHLIHTILPLLKEHNISKLIFSSPGYLNNNWLSTLGFSYQSSEYYMERNELNPLLDCKKSLIFRKATNQDIPLLCLLDEACFSRTPTELAPRFKHILSDRNYQIFLAFDKNFPVGKAHVRWQKNGATLSDIAVLPNRQGQGLGTALITYCINYALSEGRPHLNLDVGTHNQKALNLYTRLGFQTQNFCDYWEIEISQLQKNLESLMK